MRTASSQSRRSRGGFTLVEILIVIAVIILLLSLLIVGLGYASRTAQSANTRVLMQSVKTGLERFEEEVGYLPPVLGLHRELIEGPVPWAAPGPLPYDEAIQQWYSITSLAEYLVGYGPNTQDGYGSADLGETPFTGIRSPGADGVWGARQDNGIGPLGMRNPPVTGRVYGPYIELGNPRLLAGVHKTATGYSIHLPGEPGYDEADPKAIVDYWGRPIFYFRKVYPAGAPTQSFRAVDRDGDGVPDAVPSLADVFRLRPFTLPEGAEVDESVMLAGLPDARDDTTTTYALRSAEFALLSGGSDLALDETMRSDPDELNRDNIVELGP
jgi:type II secretory pathway pseudopilin PulG